MKCANIWKCLWVRTKNEWRQHNMQKWQHHIIIIIKAISNSSRIHKGNWKTVFFFVILMAICYCPEHLCVYDTHIHEIWFIFHLIFVWSTLYTLFFSLDDEEEKNYLFCHCREIQWSSPQRDERNEIDYGGGDCGSGSREQRNLIIHPCRIFAFACCVNSFFSTYTHFTSHTLIYCVNFYFVSLHSIVNDKSSIKQ